jgi:hypothetical protein
VAVADGGVEAEEYEMRTTILILIASLATLVGCTPAKPQTFDTPEAAVQALVAAARADDTKALLKVFGKAGKELIDSGDPVADKNARATFVARYEEANSLDKSVPDNVTLEVGNDKWPFPVPLVASNGHWQFDSVEGIEQLIDRRVGRNELDTIQSCLAYADAQREYYMRNPQHDPFLHYADRLISTEGKKDGLYWPAAGGEEQSPIGEGFAEARAEGYAKEGTMKDLPYHGYVYRLLTKQGPNAPGGAYEYLVDGKLLGGFAAVAFPVEYGNSGVMTFLVNHDGVVYSKDLGPDTAKLANAMDTFDPGKDWKREEGEEPSTAAN